MHQTTWNPGQDDREQSPARWPGEELPIDPSEIMNVWQEFHRLQHHPDRPWKEVLEKRNQGKLLQEELEDLFTAEQHPDSSKLGERIRKEKSRGQTDSNDAAVLGHKYSF